MCKNVHTVEYNAVQDTQKKSKERDTQHDKECLANIKTVKAA